MRRGKKRDQQLGRRYFEFNGRSVHGNRLDVQIHRIEINAIEPIPQRHDPMGHFAKYFFLLDAESHADLCVLKLVATVSAIRFIGSESAGSKEYLEEQAQAWC